MLDRLQPNEIQIVHTSERDQQQQQQVWNEIKSKQNKFGNEMKRKRTLTSSNKYYV
jgi:hypothetical protein